MSKKTWNEVVASIRPIIGVSSNEQRSLIDFLGLQIDKELPSLVVAAKLRDHLANVLALDPPKNVSTSALALIDLLSNQLDGKIEPQSDSEAKGWIDHLRLRSRVEHLEKTKIKAGDIVENLENGDLSEVSSIGDEGRVFFKGGFGAGSWPDLLVVRAEANDNSPDAEELRKVARNTVVRTAKIGAWSIAKHKELANHQTKSSITLEDIDHFEQIIHKAKDERPIQKYIEVNPHIITSLLGGQKRYCIPQKRLGAEYVPDFLICDVDSLGANWVMIELETPNSSIYLQREDLFDKYVRKGVSQIREWREWLTLNIAYARNKRINNGLGLIDIRPSCRGVVIVGRRVHLRKTKEAARNQLRDRENINVHTYDWLLDRLRGAMDFNGPTGVNPYLFQHEDE